MNYRIVKNITSAECAMLERLYRCAGWLNDGESADFIPHAVAGSQSFAVAEEHGVIIGMARAISDGVSDAYIQDVAVLTEYRRRGIGGQLVKLVANHLRDAGIDWIALVGEPGTEMFYRELGFTSEAGFTLWRLPLKDNADNSRIS